MQKRAKRTRERASAFVFFALSLTVLLAFVAFATAMSPAQTLNVSQKEDLEQAKEDCLNSLNYLKYTNNPELETAKKVIQSLQRNNYTGEITVRYYEEPYTKDGFSQRLGVIKATCQNDLDANFAKVVGINTIPVANSILWTTRPYSTNTLYSPAAKQNATMVYSVTPTSYTLKSKVAIPSFDDLPQDMQQAIQGLRDTNPE